MPVYENTYRMWEGKRRSLFHRLLAFPKFTYLQIKGKRLIHTVFVMSWLPFILFTVYIYARVNVRLVQSLRIPIQSVPAVDARFFLTFILAQLPFLFFFTLMVGPGLISTDLRHQALPMILSKPIGRWEYLLGKFLVLFLLLSILSWFQGLLLFISQTAAVPAASPWRQKFWNQSLWVLPKIVIFSFVIIFTLNLLVLMFSSLTSNIRFASVAVIMFIIGSLIVAGIVSGIFHSVRWMVFSPLTSVASVGCNLFGARNTTGVPAGSAWVYLICLWGGCVAILASRVKAFQLHRE